MTIIKGLPESCKDVEEREWEVGNAAGLYTTDLPLLHASCEVAPQPNSESGLAWLSILSGAVSASDETFLFAGSSVNSCGPGSLSRQGVIRESRQLGGNNRTSKHYRFSISQSKPPT